MPRNDMYTCHVSLVVTINLVFRCSIWRLQPKYVAICGTHLCNYSIKLNLQGAPLARVTILVCFVLWLYDVGGSGGHGKAETEKFKVVLCQVFASPIFGAECLSHCRFVVKECLSLKCLRRAGLKEA